MSEQISKELVKIFNEMADLQNKIYKIEAALFIRNSNKIIEEKISYLSKLLDIEAQNYHQNKENFYENINLIISHYKQKLNMVYDEFYCQYVNIQNELQEARLNKQVVMSNYQKIINEIENGSQSGKDYNKLKNNLKEKNELYNKIIDKCNEKFGICVAKFEQRINDEFLITTTALQVRTEVNVFQKFLNIISNIFNGKKRYSEVLSGFIKKVDKIDSQELVSQMREDTIDFVAELLELRGYSSESFDENVG